MVMNHLKLINEQQTKITHACTNLKEKLHKTNATILFSKVCLYALVGLYFIIIIKRCFGLLNTLAPIIRCFASRTTRCGYCTPTTVTIQFCVLERSSVLCRIMDQHKGDLEPCTS
jgi:hypothetical protein